MDLIEKNLYQFYQFLGSAKQINLKAENGYKVLSAEDQLWPQILFNLDQSIPPDKLIPEISEDINRKKHPSVFIAPETYLQKEHTPVLKSSGFVPFKILKGMNLEASWNKAPALDKDTKIIELKDQEHIEGFTGLVNKEVMSRDMITHSEHWSELTGNSNGSLQIFGLLRQHSLISTTLVFKKESCAGLYFIATAKEFQNKGFASVLLKYILYNLNKSNIKNVVLHANNLSFGLYKKLGFSHKNNFIIYKKL